MEKISNYKIEAYLSDSLSAEEKETFESLLSQDLGLQQKVKNLQALRPNTQFSLFRANHLLKEKKPFAWNISNWGWAVPALLLLFVFFIPSQKSPEFQAKGSGFVGLQLNQILLGEGHVQAKAKDTLRLLYRNAAPSFVLVLFQDDGGKWQEYWSGGQLQSLALDIQNQKMVHEEEVVLDDTWAKEKVIIFYHQKAFSKEEALHSLSQKSAIQHKSYTLQRNP